MSNLERLNVMRHKKRTQQPPAGFIQKHTGCPTGKYGFDTKGETKSYTKATFGKAQRAYKCYSCERFHYTSMSYQEQIAQGL